MEPTALLIDLILDMSTGDYEGDTTPSPKGPNILDLKTAIKSFHHLVADNFFAQVQDRITPQPKSFGTKSSADSSVSLHRIE
jgi:hypothetical protein